MKSLVPYPRIVHMMDSKLEWTERLGEAFLADAAAVMDSIQRLRRRAQSAGVLVSAPQAVVTTAEPEITIEPPSSEIVYFPVCDPSLVYGAWPYPAYPPDYFPDFFDGRDSRRLRLRMVQRADHRAALGLAPLELARASNRHRSRQVRGAQWAIARRSATASGGTIRPIAMAFPIAIRNCAPDLPGLWLRRSGAARCADIRQARRRKSIRLRASDGAGTRVAGEQGLGAA